MTRTFPTMLAGALAMGVAMPALAETTETSAMRAEIDTLKAQMAQMRQAQGQDWLTQRQAEEVKSLVREVLADADTRATLLQDGMYAGYDGDFFLASADGKFRLEVGGQMQFRWIGFFQDSGSAPDGDGDDEGFQVRRTKLSFAGHVTAGEREFEYEVVLAADRGSGGVEVEDFIIGTEIFDGWDLSVGKFKLPFLRQELTSSKRQLAADRGLVTEFFTLDRSEQIQLAGTLEPVKLAIAISDGADEEFSTIGEDPVEFAITARGDVKLAGDWKQARDTTAWRGEGFAAFVGGAVHWQLGDGQQSETVDSVEVDPDTGLSMVVEDVEGLGSSDPFGDYIGWTVDGSVETNGLGIFAAYMGGHIDGGSDDGRTMHGVLVEGGYMVTEQLQPFARVEWLDDDSSSDNLWVVTPGVNYYLRKHDAKLTLDAPIVLDGMVDNNPFGNTTFSDGLGFPGGVDATDDIAVAIRAQFQLLF